MVRRFYAGSEKVTALRTTDGKWLVNKIAATVPVNGYFWDKPGKHLGSVEKVGSKWNVSSAEDGNVPGFGTLASAVNYLITREVQRA